VDTEIPAFNSNKNAHLNHESCKILQKPKKIIAKSMTVNEATDVCRKLNLSGYEPHPFNQNKIKESKKRLTESDLKTSN
jgi:hypothetical protein